MIRGDHAGGAPWELTLLAYLDVVYELAAAIKVQLLESQRDARSRRAISRDTALRMARYSGTFAEF